MKRSAISKISKDPVKKLAKELEKISHDYIRQRDSIKDDKIGGYCVDCGKYKEGQQFQAGHWIPNSKGVLTRYHPHNMHGQSGGCNCKYQQEFVKINYTFAMQKKYGDEYCKKLKVMSEKIKRVNEIFYKNMIYLYQQGDEQKIVDYLDRLALKL